MVFHVILLAVSSIPGMKWPAPVAAIALGVLFAPHAGYTNYEDVGKSVLQLIIQAFYLRSFLILAIVLHEWAHIATGFLVSHFLAFSSIEGERRKRAIFCGPFIKNFILFNVPPGVWAQCLCPLVPWPIAAKPCVHIPSLEESPRQDRIVRLAGALLSLVLALAATVAPPITGRAQYPVLLASVWMVASGAAATDVLGLGGEVEGVFRCGNFGMLVVALLEGNVDIPDILRSMAATTAARGGQSGGIVTVLPDGSAVRERHVPTKRSDIAKGLVQGFFGRMRLRAAVLPFKAHAKPTCSFFLGHTRFATSSAPTVNESHPHRFSLPQRVKVWRRMPLGWEQSSETHEVYVTHNGDLEYWPLFGVQRTHHELGAWLRSVLHAKHKIAGCDSVKVGGIIELLRTQGVWLLSVRLAFQQTLSPSFDATLRGDIEALLPPATLKRAAAIADDIFASHVSSGGDLTGLNDVAALSARMAEAFTACEPLVALFPPRGTASLAEFVRRSVVNFAENDLFSALSHFLSDAHGSFGVSVCCTLDRSTVCIASRGQAMSISFNPKAGTVLWGSESAAQNIEIERVGGHWSSGKRQSSGADWKDLEMEGEGHGLKREEARGRGTLFRHDLDENDGEVMEISIFADFRARNAVERALDAAFDTARSDSLNCTSAKSRFVPFDDLPSLCLRIHRFSPTRRCVLREEFNQAHSLIDMSKVIDTRSPLASIKDKVMGDLRDIPRVLTLVQSDWHTPDGRNRRTAAQFFSMLEKLVMSEQVGGRLEVDVFVTAVEASLWIGEQFASDLQGLFPSLRVVTMSANKVIGVLSNDRGTAPMTGFSFSSLTVSLKRALVVAVSHSGQTFPTLHATHALRRIVGNRVFVLTGSVDSKMAAAVGQMPQHDAPWVGRVFHTFCGWRPSEALTVSTVACHHTLSELLLYLAKRASSSPLPFRAASGFKLSANDVVDLRRLNSTVVGTAQNLVGCDTIGVPLPATARHCNEALVAAGRKWALHVLEGPHAWLLSSAYIFGTVVSGYPLLHGLYASFVVPAAFREWAEPEWVSYFVLGLDCVLYCFLPLFFATLLRIVQGRQLWARLGKRTLVIGDVPYVHQLLESYVSKLFSLSYSIASIDVHGANIVDHLVHRFTHRVARGVLVAAGRPDGRLFSMTKAESWVLMALQQCKAIVHLLAPPEILTIGHNPYRNSSVVDAHVCLPSKRPKFMSELLVGVTEEEPMQRLAKIRQQALTQSSKVILSDFNRGEPLGVLALDEFTAEESNAMVTDLAARVHRAAELTLLEGKYDYSVHSRYDISRHSEKVQRTTGVDISRHFDASRHTAASNREDVSRHSVAAVVAGAGVGAMETVLPRAISSNFFQNIFHHDGAASPKGAPSEGQNQEEPEVSISAVVGPEALDRVLEGMDEGLLKLLCKGTPVELWHENRYASMERYLGFLVLFHAMAHRVASFLPLRFDIWRSQSQLRVATTAAPISAAEVEKEWAHDKAHVECFPLKHNASPDHTGHGQYPTVAQVAAMERAWPQAHASIRHNR